MKIIMCNLLLQKSFTGITIFPFVFLRKSYFDGKSEYILNRTIRHEKIHIEQQKELLVLPFFIVYFLEWLIKLFKYGKLSYRNISFEREAYSNKTEDYLKTRKHYSFIKYL